MEGRPPFVLVHGGGFAGSCWDRLLPHLGSDAVAVDLPGRGRRPGRLGDVTFAGCARAVEEDADRAGFGRFVLVGHSLAGCSLPATVARLGDRVSHIVFLACTVPEDGTSCVDTLDPGVRALAAEAARTGHEPAVLDRATATAMFGNDLSGEQLEWCLGRMVPESTRLIMEPVDLSPLRQAIPRTWIRTLYDAIIPAEKQDRFATNVGRCPVLDLPAGHMSMVSRPEQTAALLNALA